MELFWLSIILILFLSHGLVFNFIAYLSIKNKWSKAHTDQIIISKISEFQYSEESLQTFDLLDQMFGMFPTDYRDYELLSIEDSLLFHKVMNGRKSRSDLVFTQSVLNSSSKEEECRRRGRRINYVNSSSSGY